MTKTILHALCLSNYFDTLAKQSYLHLE